MSSVGCGRWASGLGCRCGPGRLLRRVRGRCRPWVVGGGLRAWAAGAVRVVCCGAGLAGRSDCPASSWSGPGPARCVVFVGDVVRGLWAVGFGPGLPVRSGSSAAAQGSRGVRTVRRLPGPGPVRLVAWCSWAMSSVRSWTAGRPRARATGASPGRPLPRSARGTARHDQLGVRPARPSPRGPTCSARSWAASPADRRGPPALRRGGPRPRSARGRLGLPACLSGPGPHVGSWPTGGPRTGTRRLAADVVRAVADGGLRAARPCAARPPGVARRRGR